MNSASLLRVIEVEAAIGVDENFDTLARRLAHGAHAPFVLADEIQERLSVAARETAVADGHLQPVETALDPELCRFAKLVAVEEIEAEGRHRPARVRATRPGAAISAA